MKPVADIRLYGEEHAARYLADYHRHAFWQPKVRENKRLLANLIQSMPRSAVWLDLCCGAAQHFELAPDSLHCIGIDSSPAQLEQARNLHRARRPELLCRDVRELASLRLPRANLVTCFWAALSYLGSPEEWSAVLQAAVAQMTDQDSVLYLENPMITTLMGFNETSFAREHAFRVLSVDTDEVSRWTRWRYQDAGGEHELLTPDHRRLRSMLEDLGLRVFCPSIVQTIEQLTAVHAGDVHLVRRLEALDEGQRA